LTSGGSQSSVSGLILSQEAANQLELRNG